VNYVRLNVFAEGRFSGNPLIVFPEANRLSDDAMLRIAGEVGYSETTFVAGRDPSGEWPVRIFARGAELPFAGHPSLGTAFVLVAAGANEPEIRLREVVGTIPVNVFVESGGTSGRAQMSQPEATLGPIISEVALLGEMLSLPAVAIGFRGLPAQVVSTGLPFLFIPVRDLACMGRIRFRAAIAEEVLRGTDAQLVYAFTTQTLRSESDFHGRMFADAVGVQEDPATGSAAGALAAYVATHLGIAGRQLIIEQGFEMGRPSLLLARVEREAMGRIGRASVAGRCAIVGEGTLEI
jgi:trans-2,3-dihydro-3-hydroxyanthranilate isomerase